MKSYFILASLIFYTGISFSQTTISLQECYASMETNFPLIKKNAIFERQNRLELEAIESQRKPLFSLNAQATYQSDVIQVSLPSANFEAINKDQYRATFTANQLIYNGGKINAIKNLQNATLETNKKQVETKLYNLKQHINQLYFSILFKEKEKELLHARKKQLEVKLIEVKSGIKYGVLLSSSDKVIESEVLKIEQRLNDNRKNRTSLIQSLTSLIGAVLTDDTQFQEPLIDLIQTNSLNRPELELFELKKKELTHRENILSIETLPTLSGFATGGYGNPGLNMLENSFEPYYIVGVKFNWNVFDWNINKKKRKSLALSKELINNDAEVFTLNTTTKFNEQQIEIEKLTETLVIDQQIINLQKEIITTTNAQLRNGIITSSAYITELTKLYQAENALSIHKTQLELAKANYNVLKGE